MLVGLLDNGLPWNNEAERCLIGATVLAPAKYARQFAKRVWSRDFYLPQHAWLWGRMTFAIGQQKIEWDDVVEVYRWIRRERLPFRYHDKFGGSITTLMHSCLESGMWWHGFYYCEQVLKASKKRARIMKAAKELEAEL